MTALDPNSATRVLVIPDAPSATTFQFGDVDFTAFGSAAHDIEVTEHGFPALNRDSSGGGANALELSTPTLTPPAGWTLMLAFDRADTLPFPTAVFQGDWASLVTSPEMAPVVTAGLENITSPPVDYATPLDDQPAVFIISASGVQDCYFGTDREGVLATGDPMASPGDQTSGGFTLPNMASPLRMLGIWLWEDGALSQVDAVDTAQAIATILRGEGPEPDPSGPSTIGPEFHAAVVQAVFGPAASGIFPTTFWGAWLDDELNVLVETGIATPQDAFGPTPAGVTNTVIIDGGPCPATVPAHFALMDAETGGRIVGYAPVTFDDEPNEDDALAFAPGELTFSYGG